MDLNVKIFEKLLLLFYLHLNAKLVLVDIYLWVKKEESMIIKII